ncbi:MAG: hypothetical protein OXM02_03945 [Bacteroidota bacterium]|nr:hypothetical protein [Bacteroidota bacterium]MDE2957544.1 hypothetical protein [Bacteroidota bacterium]
MVDEHIFVPIIARDEAVAFIGAEPFNGALLTILHFQVLFKLFKREKQADSSAALRNLACPPDAL